MLMRGLGSTSVRRRIKGIVLAKGEVKRRIDPYGLLNES